MFRVFKKLALYIAGMSLALAAFAQLRDVRPGFNLFSRDQDIQVGREAAAQVERKMLVLRDRELTYYVTQIVRNHTRSPRAGGYPYTFRVVADRNINAFSLPGGPVYINTGLILAADNEAQLAGVMAHEISHVALRHATNQASKSQLVRLPALLAGAIAGNGLFGQLAQAGIGLGANSVLLKFSRSAESQADYLGTQMMSEAGYNPIEMARFFEKLEAQGSGRALQFLSDHPNPGNRVRAVEEEIRYLPRKSYGANTGEFLRERSLVAQLAGR